MQLKTAFEEKMRTIGFVGFGFTRGVFRFQYFMEMNTKFLSITNREVETCLLWFHCIMRQ